MEFTKSFYSPAEVAEMAGLHRSTILNYIRSGRLYAIRLSKRTFRIPNKAVVKLLAPELANPPIIIERPYGTIDPHMLDDDSEWVTG